MKRLLWRAAVVVAVLAPSVVHAQVSPPPPAADPAPAAEPRKFSGSATVGISLESGRTDLTGIQISVLGRRPYSEFNALTMSLAYSHATTQPPGESERATVADRLTASFEVGHNLRERLVVMLRTQALRDPVAQILYRFGQMAGLGVRLGDKRFHVRIVPGLALLADDKISVVDEGLHLHYGLFQDLSTALSPTWTFNQYVLVSRDVSQVRDYIVGFDARLTGAITKRVAIQLSYQYDFERNQPPGVEPEYQKTMAGLQIGF